MGTPYIVLLTAFYVDNARVCQFWDLLPVAGILDRAEVD